MKPIRLGVPKPPPPPVPVQKFVPPKPPVAPRPMPLAAPIPVTTAENPVVPPAPSMHVGPPPAPVAAPETYEEYVKMAKDVRGGRIDMAMLWASLAQADAMNRVAESLEYLANFVNDDNEDGVSPFANDITDGVTDGVRTAMHSLKDDLIDLVPPEIKAEVISVIKARVAEALEEMRGGAQGTKPPPSTPSLFAKALENK